MAFSSRERAAGARGEAEVPRAAWAPRTAVGDFLTRYALFATESVRLEFTSGVAPDSSARFSGLAERGSRLCKRVGILARIPQVTTRAKRNEHPFSPLYFPTCFILNEPLFLKEPFPSFVILSRKERLTPPPPFLPVHVPQPRFPSAPVAARYLPAAARSGTRIPARCGEGSRGAAGGGSAPRELTAGPRPPRSPFNFHVLANPAVQTSAAGSLL